MDYADLFVVAKHGGIALVVGILFLWIILIVVGIKRNKKLKGDALCQGNVMALRGICAIEIMMGHLGIATGSAVLFPNRKAGILFVGIFFALSGYGLMYSVSNKENYLRGFLIKRLIVKLLLPAYVVFIISTILKAFCLSGGGIHTTLKMFIA